MVQLLTRLKRRLDPRLYTSGVCVCLFFFFFFFFFSRVQLLLFITVYILFTHLKILKINSTVLFTYLKIILLQCFQFSIFSKNKLYPNGLWLLTQKKFLSHIKWHNIDYNSLKWRVVVSKKNGESMWGHFSTDHNSPHGGVVTHISNTLSIFRHAHGSNCLYMAAVWASQS